MALYSLKKSKQILRTAYSRFKRKEKHLTPNEKERCLIEMRQLDALIIAGKRKEADSLARKIEAWMRTLFPKTLFDRSKELILAILFALVVATLVRTMWFELYEIPTGSMRPTFKEQDRLIASKTTFGVNVPLVAKHFLFEPELVKNSDVVIFSVENMDVYDPDTLYFYLFPGKRLLIKRLIGKPEDTLYFYGGKIYGIDKEGNELTLLQNAPWIQHIDHVPFISFEGREKQGSNNAEFFFNQSGIEIGKLQISSIGTTKGMVFNGKTWVPDDPRALLTPHQEIATYSDFWGFKNFAMARLLSAEEATNFTDLSIKDLPEGQLYLELSHTPSLTYPTPRLARDNYGHVRPLITPERTLIPLQQKHLNKLMDHLYTARFVVKNGLATRYSAGESTPLPAYDVPMPGVPDGTYEFYYGKAYSIAYGGVTTELPKDHPLYNRTLKTIQMYFNLGIDFNLLFSPKSKDSFLLPERYAYFRDGDLYVMGAPIFDKDDPVLTSFIEKELEKEKNTPTKKPYIAFIDRGAPLLENGKLDVEMIKTFGLKVPKKMYYVLGDNYAMSADGRDFGFVPEDNLRGSPAWIIWPAGDRFGPPKQPSHPLFTAPTLIIWTIFIIICGIWWWIDQKRLKKAVF